MWRPKSKKAVILVKLTCWAGLLTWMVFTLGLGLVVARMAVALLPGYLGGGVWNQVLIWIVPIWTIFTTLMLVWAVARYTNRRLGGISGRD